MWFGENDQITILVNINKVVTLPEKEQEKEIENASNQNTCNCQL